jgi:hypothetical protein
MPRDTDVGGGRGQIHGVECSGGLSGQGMQNGFGPPGGIRTHYPRLRRADLVNNISLL